MHRYAILILNINMNIHLSYKKLSISNSKLFGALFSIVLVETTCSTISMSLNVVKSGTLLLHLLPLNNKGVNIGSAKV